MRPSSSVRLSYTKCFISNLWFYAFLHDNNSVEKNKSDTQIISFLH